MAATQPPNFLDLPPELRLIIYEMVFEDCTLNIEYIDLEITPRAKTPAPSFLATCKQIYTEAHDIYWTAVIVKVGERQVLDVATHIPRARRLSIGRIEIFVRRSGTENEKTHSGIHDYVYD